MQVPALQLAPYACASYGQQTAELYGVAVAVAAAAVARQSAVIVTDNSVCVAWFHGALIPATRHQIHLLLPASLLTTLSGALDCTMDSRKIKSGRPLVTPEAPHRIGRRPPLC